VNWDVFDPVCTPVVEILSEHGAAETDRGEYPYFNHSMGGRVTANTAQAGLARGLRFGFVASTDNHRGFPGAYGEGVMAVLAERLDRASIMEAIRRRRTYALTGDRIELSFSVDGHPMGADVTVSGSAEAAFDVRGRDEIDVVELIQDGRVVHRAYPTDVDPTSAPSRRVQLRFEWGWGPWADLDLDRIADWEFEIEARGAGIDRLFPCLQSGPFDEDRRHRVRLRDKRSVSVTSYTGRKGGFRGNPNQSLVVDIEGSESALFVFRSTRPSAVEHTITLGELRTGSAAIFMGPFPAESALWHRAIDDSASHVTGAFGLTVADERSYVYLRVRQKNGQIAWSSPVFMNYD
jgi:hypothetical protein